MESAVKAKPLEVKEASDLAEFYHVPQSIVNMFFSKFNDTLYPKEPFLLYLGHKKGIQAIQATKPKQNDQGEWTCEATIYPRVDARTLELLLQYEPKERARLLEYMMMPTTESGRASTKNVHAPQIQAWLPEMAIKRAVCRALRLFSGVGGTSYEELPDADVSKEELEDQGRRVVTDATVISKEPATTMQPTLDAPSA